MIRKKSLVLFFKYFYTPCYSVPYGDIGPFFSCPENLDEEKTFMIVVTRKLDIASDAH